MALEGQVIKGLVSDWLRNAKCEQMQGSGITYHRFSIEAVQDNTSAVKKQKKYKDYGISLLSIFR